MYFLSIKYYVNQVNFLAVWEYQMPWSDVYYYGLKLNHKLSFPECILIKLYE